MKKAYQYRLYPNAQQASLLLSQINACRALYNVALEQRMGAYKEKKISLNYYDQAAQLKECRDASEPLSAVNYSALQDVLRRLQKTYQSFFRRMKQGQKAGFPRFKPAQRYTSMTFPKYGDGCRISQGRLKLQNVGRLKVKWHRKIEGKVKTVTLYHKNGKWFVIFCVETSSHPLPKMAKSVGLDLGIQSFLATNEGHFVENPQFLRASEQALKIKQRQVSKKKLRGSNRRKAVEALRQQHEKIHNQRKDFHHKLALDLLKNYDQIFVEKLNVKGMVQNHRLAKSISDAGWRSFLNILHSKAESAEKEVIQVNPRNTSQQCSGCHKMVKKSLSVRTHHCNFCGLSLDRDVNAARNIFRLGHSLWLETEVA